MQTPLDCTLARRLAALERRARLQTLALAVLVVVPLTTAALARDGEPDVVRARAIQMVDAEGRVRAELAIDDDGSAGLFVRDSEGRARACVVHDESQSALYVLDAEGQIRVGAAQYAHGGGGFALHGPKGKGGAVLYLKERSSLRFFDADGGVLAELPERR